MRLIQRLEVLVVGAGVSLLAASCSGGSSDAEAGLELGALAQALSPQLEEDCATQCATSQQLGCGETEAACIAECLNVEPIRSSCQNRYADLIECAAGLDSSGFVCLDGVAFITGCAEEASTLTECQGGPSPQGLNGLCRAQCNRLSELECALPIEQCFEQCRFFSQVGAPCGREFQALTVCTTQAAPEGFSCEFPELGPVSFFICLDEQAALEQCFESL
jgi:hypothetical protein